MQRVTTKSAKAIAAALVLSACAGGKDTSTSLSPGTTSPHVPSATEWSGARAKGGDTAKDDAGVTEGWVLHIGDSFVEAWLWQNLRPRFRSLGTKYVVQAETSTYTTTWANSPLLDEWLERRPSLVIVTLGANEVDNAAPEEHGRAIETIAKKIAKVHASCVWMTPPMWKKDSGILEVIHRHSAPCVFFDSDAVLNGLHPDERQRDGIHPNPRGGERWARAFWDWLNDHRDPKTPRWSILPFERRGS